MSPIRQENLLWKAGAEMARLPERDEGDLGKSCHRIWAVGREEDRVMLSWNMN